MPTCLCGQNRLLHLSPWNYKSFNAYNYIHTGNVLTYIDTQGRFNNYTTCSLDRILVMETRVVSEMKMGNIVSRAGIKPTYLTFEASVLPLHRVGSYMLPVYSHLCSSLPERSMQTTTSSSVSYLYCRGTGHATIRKYYFNHVPFGFNNKLYHMMQLSMTWADVVLNSKLLVYIYIYIYISTTGSTIPKRPAHNWII